MYYTEDSFFCIASYLSPYGNRGRYAQRLHCTSQEGLEDRDKFCLYNSLWFGYSMWMMQVSATYYLK